MNAINSLNGTEWIVCRFFLYGLLNEVSIDKINLLSLLPVFDIGHSSVQIWWIVFEHKKETRQQPEKNWEVKKGERLP